MNNKGKKYENGMRKDGRNFGQEAYSYNSGQMNYSRADTDEKWKHDKYYQMNQSSRFS